MKAFSLDPRLEEDSVFVCDMPLCAVRVHKNALYHWLILIPRREGVREIFELSAQDQGALMEEVSRAGRFLKELCQAHKINVGALGNIVSQLHVHVIARDPKDPAWPGPVWGTPHTKAYDENTLKTLIKNLQQGLGGSTS
ncbi:MAG: diadenosine tetraphosphate hydrolase [Candidatus Puniceispirillum sp.]|nr:diadenosine tetraphosphate hydrolase [Candidatus Puniceispirillum sp.]